jgi:hypothetical protein
MILGARAGCYRKGSPRRWESRIRTKGWMQHTFLLVALSHAPALRRHIFFGLHSMLYVTVSISFLFAAFQKICNDSVESDLNFNNEMSVVRDLRFFFGMRHLTNGLDKLLMLIACHDFDSSFLLRNCN